MKIQLDLKSLERLLAGDTEAEITFRQSAVEEFAKRHLKVVVNDERFQKFLKAESGMLAIALDKAIEEHVGSVHTWPESEVLTKDVVVVGVAP